MDYSLSVRIGTIATRPPIIKTLIPAAKPGGRPRSVDLRGIMNGIFYILVAGCAWSLLPHDFPNQTSSKF